MEKIRTLSYNEWTRLSKAEDKESEFKKILGLQGRYILGDTAVSIENSEMLGAYKHRENGRDFYYIVVNILSKEHAFAWSLFEVLTNGEQKKRDKEI
jgi:nitrogen regulatory protein PII-like uncharacterized protein